MKVPDLVPESDTGAGQQSDSRAPKRQPRAERQPKSAEVAPPPCTRGKTTEAHPSTKQTCRPGTPAAY
ncbi:hypothetical protein NDU88_002409 [Pleurodeles waltl]|uniref:Uncharacterized protein n=1 Tax=Pleurodeles waltl TaxID=8319 RepID=A0AAV7T2B4_PLEWA|nr:hypothetical protein NDU88_002409 [Pleurodeles waltl]